MMLLMLLCAICAIIPQYTATNLLANIPRCYVDDPKLNNCLLNATIVLKPSIKKGIKGLGIPSYDPLVLPEFDVSQESEMVNYTAKLFNFTIWGMDNYDITEIRYDPKTMTFTGKIEFDPLSIRTDFITNGHYISIPVLGKGVSHSAFGPINGTFEITGKMIKRKGIDYYDPVDVKIMLYIDDFSVYDTGIFDGDKELEILINDLLNQNSKTITYALTPMFERLSEKFILRYFKWLTKKYPYDTLFPQHSQP